MSNLELIATSTTHQMYAYGLRFSGRPTARDAPHGIYATTQSAPTWRDRGAVSLEQVLWFVAAGVSVAVIASILWGQIRDKADDPVNTPVAP